MIGKFYNRLPDSFKSNISKVTYLIGNKPRVLIDNKLNFGFPGNQKGGVIFSADFELGWAVRYSKHPKDPVKFASEERKNIPFILVDNSVSVPVFISWIIRIWILSEPFLEK